MSKYKNYEGGRFNVTIVGAGVVGVTIGRELQRRGVKRILILEKEPDLGRHSSGRNSGVLHAGIYYPPGTLRARLCVEGAIALRQYLEERKLPFAKCGKLILPQEESLADQIPLLRDRAEKNGVQVHEIGPTEIAEIEPAARRASKALFSPNTWMFDPKEVLKSISKDFVEAGGILNLDDPYLSFEPKTGVIKSEKNQFVSGQLINAAGLWADKVAHDLDVGKRYRILPFRGRYSKLRPEIAVKIRGLIYPVPDLDLPFLGVHVTRHLTGVVSLGPTAMPAWGRENYQGLNGLSVKDSVKNFAVLAEMILKNTERMRAHVVNESKLHFRSVLHKQLQKLVPSLEVTDVLPYEKVGLRAQVVDLKENRLCMDFLIEKGEKSLHVINAISPAFSASFAFAREVVDQLEI